VSGPRGEVHAALAARASISRYAQGGGDARTVLACPTPRHANADRSGFAVETGVVQGGRRIKWGRTARRREVCTKPGIVHAGAWVRQTLAFDSPDVAMAALW
jgi:hypothetical protein